ncbi:MAG: hypothetical protein KAT68_00005 [Bacteroidales bacterium]|nr:hypothetical protein [Bacteroidales bacterium]
MNKIIILSIIIVLAAFSCKNKLENEYIDKTDSLLVIVDDFLIEIQNIDIDSIKIIQKQVTENVEIFKNTYFEMPDDKQFMIDFGNYANVHKSIKHLLRDYNSLIKEINLSKTQITGLKHDLSHGLINGVDSIKIYFDDEHKAVNFMNAQIKSINEAVKKNKRLYKKLHDKMEKFKNDVVLKTDSE